MDESGDHSLNSVDQAYPVFVLAVCVFRKRDYVSGLLPALTDFKFDAFGHDQVVLHERDIRKGSGPFGFMRADPLVRDIFLTRLTKIIRDARFTTIASVIKKNELKGKYPRPFSPYDLALRFCLERLAMHLKEIGGAGSTHVVVERRGGAEDAALEKAFREICAGDNRLNAGLPLELVFADKRANSAGLQLADLVARPIGLNAIRPDQPNEAFDVVRPKLRTNNLGQTEGFGLKHFPGKS